LLSKDNLQILNREKQRTVILSFILLSFFGSWLNESGGDINIFWHSFFLIYKIETLKIEAQINN
jgi:hypothetical protein